MTEMRDARLRKAMEQAPDGDARPGASARAAIHAAAHAAVRPWWRRWRPQGAAGAPWAAILATVLVATLATVLWQDRELPGPRPEQRVAGAPETQDGSDAVAVGPGAPAAAPPVAVAPAPAPAATAAPAAPAPPAATAAAPSPAPAPAAPAPPPPAAAAQAPAAGAQEQPGPPTIPGGWEGWTQARIEAGSASVVVPRAQAGVLAPLVARMLGAPAARTALTPEAQLRIELAQGEQDLGVLELAGNDWRWRPLRDAQEARGLLPESALSTALEAEARRLLRK